MKRKILAMVIFSCMLLSYSGIIVSAEDYELSWHYTEDDILLQQGDNWFTIQLTNDDGANLHDIYFEVITEIAYPGLYTELYYNSKSNLLSGDGNSSDIKSLFCLSHQSASTGRYYINVHAPNEGIYITITPDKYSASSGTYEPNNRFHFAHQLNLSVDTVIQDNLGTYGDDVDFYAYTTTEPCMLTVDLYDYEFAELSIYSGETLVASTDIGEVQNNDGATRIRQFPYRFNFTHGICYFKVSRGEGSYTLHITKGEYQATPVVNNLSPLNRLLYSEFDILTPAISVLANGTVTASYLYIKDGSSYEVKDKTILANNKTFTEYHFPDLLPSQVSPGTRTQNDIQFYVKSLNSGEAYVNLNFDNAPPECEDVSVQANEDSIEVTVIGAVDEIQLASTPYRYRIYPSGTTPPAYSEWLTQGYYSSGIDTGGLSAGSYTVEVQIRDQIAENYQSGSQDLSNHILTVTKTAQIS